MIAVKNVLQNGGKDYTTIASTVGANTLKSRHVENYLLCFRFTETLI
jgi:hypothetical protein